MSKVKEPATYREIIEKIKSRGFLLEDEADCEKILSSVGYYRLSAYFLPFKRKDGSYISGISFTRIFRIYEFDRKLRNLLLGAIEVAEVYLRTALSDFHAKKYGPLGYLNASTFNEKHNAKKFHSNILREIENNKKVLFVKHHLEHYDGKFPLWVISELFTFGMLSYFYTDLTTKDKKLFAGSDYRDIVSFLRCCTDLRNICAHYGRLYFRIFSAMPSKFDLTDREKRRLWGSVLALKELYPSVSAWNAEFMPALLSLFEEYKEDISLHHIAFPENFAEQLVKQNDRIFCF